MTSGTTDDLYGIWGSSPSDVYACGTNGIILHYNGKTWSPMVSNSAVIFTRIWGSSPSDIFAVATLGAIQHYDGKTWSGMTITVPVNWFYDVWGMSSSDVFAVGGGGTILHYDGNAWTNMSSGTTNTIADIWGSSPSNVFAVGFGDTILHYDGSTWSSMTSGTTALLTGIWGDSPSDIFVVGSGGFILHYDGNAWSSLPGGSTTNFYSDWGTSSSDVFAMGTDGTIWHYSGYTVVPTTLYSINQIVTLGNLAQWTITSAQNLGNDISAPYHPKTTVGKFIEVSFTVENLSSKTITAVNTPTIIDSQNREFQPMDDYWDYVPQGMAFVSPTLQPDIPAQYEMIYELPLDSNGLKFKVNDLTNSLVHAQTALVNLGF